MSTPQRNVVAHATQIHGTDGAPVDPEMVDAALSMSLSLVPGGDRRTLERILAHQNLPIQRLEVRVKPMASREDQTVAIADAVARGISAELARPEWRVFRSSEDLSRSIEQLSREAAGKSKEGTWARRVLQALFPARQQWKLTDEEREAAGLVGEDVRAQILKELGGAPSGKMISIEKVAHLNEAFARFAASRGLKVHKATGAAPALKQAAHDFTSFTHVDTDKDAGGLSKVWAKLLENNIRHEAVHAVHMIQTRLTIMEQVCAREGVSSVAALDDASLLEIQLRVAQFESGSNYPQFEKLACRVGGAGGRKDMDEARYRDALLVGTREVEAALRSDDQLLKVKALNEGPDGQGAIGKMWFALTETMGLRGGSMYGRAFGSMGDSQTKMMVNSLGPIAAAALLKFSVGLAAPYAALPLLWWLLRQQGWREKVGAKMLPSGDR